MNTVYSKAVHCTQFLSWNQKLRFATKSLFVKARYSWKEVHSASFLFVELIHKFIPDITWRQKEDLIFVKELSKKMHVCVHIAYASLSKLYHASRISYTWLSRCQAFMIGGKGSILLADVETYQALPVMCFQKNPNNIASWSAYHNKEGWITKDRRC